MLNVTILYFLCYHSTQELILKKKSIHFVPLSLARNLMALTCVGLPHGVLNGLSLLSVTRSELFHQVLNCIMFMARNEKCDKNP